MREAECQARAHADPAGDPDDPGGAVKPDGPPKYSDQEQLSRQSDYRACGSQPRWRADGKELFYISGDKKLMAVSIDTAGGKVVAGVPHVLFQTRIIARRIVLFQYAVAPDGKRFLINSLPSVGATPLTVLMN